MAEQERTDGVGMKHAVDIALSALNELYSNAPREDVLLEEVWHNVGKQEWEVTLGFARPYSTVRPGAVSDVFPQAKPRAYKRFIIDANTGELLGMLDGKIDID